MNHFSNPYHYPHNTNTTQSSKSTINQIWLEKLFTTLIKEVTTAITATALPCPPLPWDDFLDFSRMSSPPSADIGYYRIIQNVTSTVQFKGNYVWLAIAVVLVCGGVARSPAVYGACAMALLCWVVLCRIAMIDETSVTFEHRKKIISVAERNHIGGFFTLLSFTLFPGIRKTLLISLLVLFLIISHAVSRPILNEEDVAECNRLKRKRAQKNHRNSHCADGFTDSGDDDDEMYFSAAAATMQESANERMLRRRNGFGHGRGKSSLGRVVIGNRNESNGNGSCHPGLVLPSGGGYDYQSSDLGIKGKTDDPLKRS